MTQELDRQDWWEWYEGYGDHGGRFFSLRDDLGNDIICGETGTIDDEAANLLQSAPAMLAALKTARSALRSYQYGNSAPDLAAEVADHIDRLIDTILGEQNPG